MTKNKLSPEHRLVYVGLRNWIGIIGVGLIATTIYYSGKLVNTVERLEERTRATVDTTVQLRGDLTQFAFRQLGIAKQSSTEVAIELKGGLK